MTIALVQQPTPSQSFGVTSKSHTFSSTPTSGNLLVFAVVCAQNATITADDGTLTQIGTGYETFRRISIFAKIAGGSEPTTYSFTISTAGDVLISIAEYSTTDTWDPVSGAQFNIAFDSSGSNYNITTSLTGSTVGSLISAVGYSSNTTNNNQELNSGYGNVVKCAGGSSNNRALWADKTAASTSESAQFNLIDTTTNNRLAVAIAEFTVSGGASASVDTVDDPVTVGSNAHTVSNFGSTVNTGRIFSGTAQINFTAANNTSATIPTIADTGNAVPFGSVTYELGDGTDTATIATTYSPPAGYAYVALTSGFDTSSTSFLYTYGGTPAIGDQFMYPSASLTLNSDGTMSGTAGTYGCFAVDISDAQPTYEAFDVILGEAGDTTAPVLSAPGFSSVGSTSVTLSATTDEANGTMYFYVSANSTETAATIKAANKTKAISTTGSQSYNYTGLTASTSYYGHVVHEDAATNTSNVVSTTQFTTSAASAGVPVASRQTWGELVAYLYDQGYRGSSDDIVYKWLVAEGYTTGTQFDKFYKYLGDLGYTGTLSDRMYQWRNDV